MPVTYNAANATLHYLYRATNGGTVFSANLNATAAFDYFDDSAVVNDALYFGSATQAGFSDIAFNIGTALVGTGITIVWEFPNSDTTWATIPGQQDDTVGFTLTGSRKFKFGMPYGWTRRAVNGSNASTFWVRARISALASISEGGANQTSAVTIADGKVNVTGYSDASPCTFADVKAVLDSYPWLGVTKTNNHYDFTSVSLNIASRLKTTKESFEIGLGGSHPGMHNLSYLQMGEKVSDYFGKNGSTMWLRAAPNSYPITLGVHSKFYGSNIICPDGAGYPYLVGEWVDCNIDGMNPGNSDAAMVIRNCRISTPGVWICSVRFPPTFERNRVLMTGTQLAYFYQESVTIRDIDYATTATSGVRMFYLYATNNNPTFTVINPNPRLPSIFDANRPAYRSATAPAQNHAKVFYYQASSGTYTDYTSQFNSDTANDAPIHGEVGDCYYFGMSYPGHNPAWQIFTSLASNDYEYTYEYYLSGDWRTFSPVWDAAQNFTVNQGLMYFGKDITPGTQSLLTINGYAGYWNRMRITKKGTGTPHITRIKVEPNQTGCGSWQLIEKFSLAVVAVDVAGNPISGAQVLIDYQGTNAYSGTTDSTGAIPQQDLESRRWYFDPINAPSNYHQIAEEERGAYDVTVRKAGYETVRMATRMEAKRDLRIKLRHSVWPGRDEMGEEFR